MVNMLYAVCDHPEQFLQAMEMQTNDLMEYLDEIESARRRCSATPIPAG